jgi:outer membrane protein OmpA-like peptidoglycan-associated protein
MRPRAPQPAAPVIPTPNMPGPFIVYFDFDSSQIRPEAAAVLDQAIAAYRQLADSTTRVMIAAHTDNRGSAAYNMGLSRREAASVRDYLVAHGIAARVITMSSFGGTRPRAAGNSEDMWIMNRRAEITFAESPARR